MKVIGVIPARWGSTRFEGKVLAKIGGKPMIQHVWERARKSKQIHDLIIACDDERILLEVKRFGARALMTSRKHKTGSDRIAEAVAKVSGDIVINIQGDEPFIHPTIIDRLAVALMRDSVAVMATAVKILTNKGDLDNSNIIKVVVDQKGFALYFSRAAIPFNRDHMDFKKVTYYKHLGIYAYRKHFLLKYCRLPQSYLEGVEKLEQLRALEAGFKIKTVVTDLETIGVDTPADLKRAEAYFKGKKRNG